MVGHQTTQILDMTMMFGHLKRSNKRKPATNIVLAIVGLTVVNSTFVILSGICANVELTFFKYPTIAKPKTVVGKRSRRHINH
jgi:hypothetical protein